jgi:hyaluronoglucosaminidase
LTVTSWCGVLEGFYGTPFADADRVELIRWLGARGGRDYVYAPKGDPLLRDRWREPFPDVAWYAELHRVAAEAGVRLSVAVSPGLDWRGDDDVATLVAKLRSLADVGIASLGIAFDDVPRGGAELGAAHGRAVAAAAEALPGVSVATCPVDYAAVSPTSYLKAFAAALPEDVAVLWTGPSIVSPTVTADDVTSLSGALGRTLVLADNVPVNDGAMAGVLHLGPYPERDPAVPALTGGLLLNLMPGHPLASRVGVAAALRWWADPAGDREQQWREVVAEVPGLEPLARACRSWLTAPDADPELAAWAWAALDDGDPRLQEWLGRGCRDGLAEDWQVELGPWLEAWELLAVGLTHVLEAVRSADPVEAAFGIGEVRRRVRSLEPQLLGIREAVYPVTRQEGDRILPDRSGVVTGHDLPGRLCDEALDRCFRSEA